MDFHRKNINISDQNEIMFIHNEAPFELGNKSVYMHITTEENPGVPLTTDGGIRNPCLI